MAQDWFIPERASSLSGLYSLCLQRKRNSVSDFAAGLTELKSLKKLFSYETEGTFSFLPINFFNVHI